MANGHLSVSKDATISSVRSFTSPITVEARLRGSDVQCVMMQVLTPDGLRPGELWVQGSKIVDPQTRFWQRRATPTVHRRKRVG